MEQLANVLDLIEHDLKQHQLWSECSPRVQALQSSTPFAADVMNFNEWLQWICLPRLRYLLEHHLDVPSNCLITPMAEHYALPASLIFLLHKLDDLLTKPS